MKIVRIVVATNALVSALICEKWSAGGTGRGKREQCQSCNRKSRVKFVFSAQSHSFWIAAVTRCFNFRDLLYKKWKESVHTRRHSTVWQIRALNLMLVPHETWSYSKSTKLSNWKCVFIGPLFVRTSTVVQPYDLTEKTNDVYSLTCYAVCNATYIERLLCCIAIA